MVGNALRAFKVSINGTHTRTAGVGASGSVDFMLAWTDDPVPAQGTMLVALTARTPGQHLSWDLPQIAPGDVITIEVTHTDTLDPPSHGSPMPKQSPWDRGRRTFKGSLKRAITRVRIRGPKPLRGLMDALYELLD